MEAEVKAKKIGGSIGIILPREIVEKERIHVDDTINISLEKADDISFLRGAWKNIRKSTKEIMKEIDEGEYE